MHQYELMVILDPEIDERTVAPSLDKFLGVIRADGGTIEKVDIWGKRRLAYEINKKSEGIYAVVDMTATSASTIELDRQLKLSEAVMRTKVLRAEEAIAQVTEAAKLSAEKAARKAAATPKAPAKAPGKAAEKPATETVDKTADKSTDKTAEKAAEKSTDKAADKTASVEDAAAEKDAE